MTTRATTGDDSAAGNASAAHRAEQELRHRAETPRLGAGLQQWPAPSRDSKIKGAMMGSLTGLQNLGADSVFRPRKRMSSFFPL